MKNNNDTINFDINKKLIVKSKNRRIIIHLLETEDGSKKIVELKTRRLVDFNKRLVTNSTTTYTLESFVLLYDILRKFIFDGSNNDFFDIPFKTPIEASVWKYDKDSKANDFKK